MGGDINGLLRRCCDLVGAGGLVICEVDPAPDRYGIEQVVLTGGRHDFDATAVGTSRRANSSPICRSA